jgi:monoterpene epsilon-lactone hydrolase
VQAILKTLTRLFLRVFLKPLKGPPLPLGFTRRWLSLMAGFAPPPRGTERRELDLGAVPALHLSDGVPAGPPETRDAILLCHGGAFVAGGAGTHAGLAAWLARSTGADVYLPVYRLAPEHPHPAASDDLHAAYRAVLGLGHSPSRTAIVGDSAGGALALTTVRALPEMSVPSPAALVLISPWLDLTLSSGSMAANARRDPMLRRPWLETSATGYAGGLSRSDPRISPLFSDLRNLPPTLVQVGSDEILLDDSTRFADRAFAAGVDVELQRFDGWWHDFQALAGYLHGAREALEDIAAFLRRRLG